MPGGTCGCQNRDGQTMGSAERGSATVSRSRNCERRSSAPRAGQGRRVELEIEAHQVSRRHGSIMAET